jgi:hypothetical protein
VAAGRTCGPGASSRGAAAAASAAESPAGYTAGLGGVVEPSSPRTDLPTPRTVPSCHSGGVGEVIGSTTRRNA